MPTVTGTQILDKAELVLQDSTNVRWSPAELLGWLNDGQRELVILRPDACNKTTKMTLAAGALQTLPSDGYQLLNVLRNFDAAGTVPGRAVRKVSQEMLDAVSPSWYTLSNSSTVIHYTYDQRSPRSFYVYPPASGTTKVEILYSVAPTDLAAASNTITVDDIYANALLDYVLYRAFSKDFELTGTQARAEYHYGKFLSALGAKAAVDAAISPNNAAVAR